MMHVRFLSSLAIIALCSFLSVAVSSDGAVTVNADPITYSSDHPYSSFEMIEFVVSFPGAVMLNLSFSKDSEVEKDFDFITICSTSSCVDQWAYLTGAKLPGSNGVDPLVFTTSSFYFLFTSDDIFETYGYDLTVTPTYNYASVTKKSSHPSDLITHEADVLLYDAVALSISFSSKTSIGDNGDEFKICSDSSCDVVMTSFSQEDFPGVSGPDLVFLGNYFYFYYLCSTVDVWGFKMTATRLDAVPVLGYESEHPYSNNDIHIKHIIALNAIALTLNFDSATSTEEDHDFVTICKDASCAENWGSYSGTNFPGVGGVPVLMIPSFECYLRFTSDGSSKDWGYNVTVTPLDTFPNVTYVSPHPYLNSVSEMYQISFPLNVPLSISFNSATSTEEDHDFVTICKDASCTENWGSYSGTNFPGVGGVPVLIIPDDNFYFQFVSDSARRLSTNADLDRSLLNAFWGYEMTVTPLDAYPPANYFSPHPYKNNRDEYTHIYMPNVLFLGLSFDSATSTEKDHDFVTICKDASCTENWGSYSGTNFPGVGGVPVLMIPSFECYLRFTSDGSSKDWGYAVTVTPVASIETKEFESAHPYPTDMDGTNVYKVSIPGAVALNVMFSNKTLTGYSDYVFLCKEETCGEMWGVFSGESPFPGVAIVPDLLIPADYFYVRMFSDDVSYDEYGYFMSVTAVYSMPEVDVTVYVDDTEPDFVGVGATCDGDLRCNLREALAFCQSTTYNTFSTGGYSRCAIVMEEGTDVSITEGPLYAFPPSDLMFHLSISITGLGSGGIIRSADTTFSVFGVDALVEIEFHLSNLLFISEYDGPGAVETGGAISLWLLNTVSIENCIFRNFVAINDGGTLYVSTTKRVYLRNVIIEDSMLTADGQRRGGAIFSENCQTVELVNVSVSGGSDNSVGGAVANMSPRNVYVGNSNFFNVSADVGGAIFVAGQGLNYGISVEHTVFSQCAATDVHPYPDIRSGSGGAIAVENTISLIVRDSLFLNNIAVLAGGAMYAPADVDAVTLTDNMFTHNVAHGEMSNSGGGACYFLENDIVMKNVVFDDNSALNGGGVYVRSTTVLSMTNISFLDNVASVSGGGMYLYDALNVEADNCVVSGNRAVSGGGLYMAATCSNFLLMNSSVSYNYARYFGAGLYYGDNSDVVNLINVDFVGNSALFKGGGIYFLQFSDNIIIDECNFDSNKCEFGCGIFVYQVVKNISISNSDFLNNKAVSAGGALYVENQNEDISFDVCTFIENEAIDDSGGAVFVGSQNKRIAFTSCVFEKNTAATEGGAIVLTGSNEEFHASNCVFVENVAVDGGAINSKRRNGLLLSHNVYRENAAIAGYGGAIFIGSMHANPAINYSTFEENVAERGGALYIGSEASLFNVGNEVAHGTFSSNEFMNNTANVGGAILFARAFNTVIFNCTFADNAAGPEHVDDGTDLIEMELRAVLPSTFMGGAVTILSHSINMTIDGCEFRNNVAALGSIIFSDSGRFININSCTIVNNTAWGYGAVFWWYSDDNALELEPSIVDAIYYDNNYGSRSVVEGVISLMATQGLYLSAYDGNTLNTTTVFVEDYFADAPFVVAVLDHYGSLKWFNSGTSITASLNSSFYGCDVQGSGALSGSSVVPTLKGISTFNNLLMSCYPTGFFFVFFQSSAFAGTSILVNFLNCGDGYTMVNFKCVQCGAGTYSLEYSHDATCEAAPANSNVKSTQGNEIIVDAGFWRINEYATTILECPYSAGCKGENLTGIESCEVGYDGVLCSVCGEGFFPDTGAFGITCLSCDNATSLILLLVAPMIILLVVIAFVAGDQMKLAFTFLQSIASGNIEVDEEGANAEDVAMNQALVNNNTKNNFIDSLLGKLKIMISAYQIVAGFPKLLNIEFPVATTSLFNIFGFVNAISFNVNSMTCYTDGYDFVSTLLFTTLFPIGLSLLLLLAAAVEAWRCSMSTRVASEKRVEYHRVVNQYFTLFLLLTYIILPSVSATIASSFGCTDADPDDVVDGDDLYLTADLSISCTSPKYQFILGYAILMLFVYPIGIPALYFSLLYSFREEISKRNDPNFEVKKTMFSYDSLKFLFKVYEPEFWYWEIVETMRRLFFTCILALGLFGPNYQIVFTVVISILFMKLYGFYAPYDDKADDVLQEISQYQVYFTLFGAMVLKYNVLGDSDSVVVTIGILLVIVNVVSIAVAIHYTFFFNEEDEEEEEKKIELQVYKEAASEADDAMSDTSEGMQAKVSLDKSVKEDITVHPVGSFFGPGSAKVVPMNDVDTLAVQAV